MVPTMSRHNPNRSDNLRRALAQEAARIMAEHGIRDFLIAKRKAAERMGVTDVAAVLPRNVEIEDALAEYQRLLGAVLSGTATEHSDVQLHLFADRAESVTIKLMDEGIPHEVTEKRVRMNAERVLAYPGVRFELDEQSIEATVFPTDGIRQAPVSPVDGRPMRRASKLEVEALLDS